MSKGTRAHGQNQDAGETISVDWAQRLDAQDATIAGFGERMGGVESLLRSIAENQQKEQQLRATQADRSREADNRGPQLGGGLGEFSLFGRSQLGTIGGAGSRVAQPHTGKADLSVLQAAPANSFPRQGAQVVPTLAMTPAGEQAAWVPLISLGTDVTYQRLAEKGGKGGDAAPTSLLFELQFLYSILSYLADVQHNLQLVQSDMAASSTATCTDRLQAAQQLLQGVQMLGSKRHTQLKVIAEADGKAAGILHYSSFGSCDGAGITDPEDQAILKDLRTQTLKELRKAAASKQTSWGKGPKGGERPDKGNHKPHFQKKTNQGPAQQGSGSA